MKKKKGFTLIELLAVIVILAVIMVIAVPQILDVIEKSKESAAESSAELYIDAVNKNNALSEINSALYSKIEDGEEIDIKSLDIKLKGEGPSSGNITIEKGKVKNANLCIYNYNVEYIGKEAKVNGKCGDESINNSNIGQTFVFEYTGNEQIFTVPYKGKYKIEIWGAQGGSWDSETHGGYGAYSIGEYTFEQDKIIYINIGGEGIGDKKHTYKDGGYNGGGNANPDDDPNTRQASGGGASHMSFKSGLLSTLNNNFDEIIIVSGGGGGAGVNANLGALGDKVGGNAGGIKGNNGEAFYIGINFYGNGGTQSEGGDGYENKGSFGKGGDGLAAGGGGGFYGGGSGQYGSGGGSSYIGNELLKNKAMYCYNCTESSEELTKTISTTCVSETPTEKCTKQGNGYAKIIYLGKK